MLGYMTYRAARSTARAVSRSSKNRRKQQPKPLPIGGVAFLALVAFFVVVIVLYVNFMNAKY